MCDRVFIGAQPRRCLAYERLPITPACPSTREERVPRILHAVARGVVPYTVTANARANPTYRLHYHNDSSARAFVARHCGVRVARAYDCFASGANRADLFRFCALFAMGGVYLDADLLLVVPLESTYAPCRAVTLGHDFPTGSRDEAKQMKIVAGIRRHPLFRCMIQRIVRHAADRALPENALFVSGPGLLQQCYDALPTRQRDVALTYLDTRNARWPYTGMRTRTRLLAFEVPNIARAWFADDPDDYDRHFRERSIYASQCALPLPACRGARAVARGRWERLNGTSEHAPPPCCGWDADHWRARHAECGTRPQRRDDDGLSFAGDGEQIAHVGHMGCTACDDAASAGAYAWKPKGCTLAPWDARRFCALGASVLLVGDSLQSQLTSVLLAYLWIGLDASERAVCLPRVRYAHSDTLVNRSLGHMNRGRPWTAWVRQYVPDVVVLSAGAHIGDTDAHDVMLREVEAGVATMRRELPSTRVVWRTNLRGGCAAYGAELPAPRYNWNLFDAFDDAARMRWDPIKVSLVDMAPFAQRPDAHTRDCLHYCVPGALALWPRLLLHALQTTSA